jgi:tRNA-guanine family transglycosylase
VSRELSVYRFNSIHNLHFYQRLMEGMREAIVTGAFSKFYREFHENLNAAVEDEEGAPGSEQEYPASQTSALE